MFIMKIMDENNTSIFTQAKIEYTQQLIDVLTPNMFDGMKSIYDESKVVFSTQTNKSILTLFRSFLEKVPEWNNALVETETERIIKESRCDWLDDLVTAVFISHTKILTSIGPNLNNTRINLTIPKTINFIHKCYINLAREIWKNPYLFDENINGSDYQRNMRTIELIIKDSIENTIRKLLPFKEILKEHLDTFDTNEIENKKRQENQSIQALLLEEIRSLKNNMNNSDNSDNETEKDEEEEDKSPDKKELLTDIVNGLLNKNDDDKEEEDKVKELTKLDDISYNQKPNLDGYESPDENKISQECENIEIATIKDITQEPIQDTCVVEELKYDNTVINNPEKKNEDLMETFKNKLLTLENQNASQEVTDIKSDLSSPKVINIEENLYSQTDPLFNNDIKEVITKQIPEEIKQGSNEEDTLNYDLKGIIMGKTKVTPKLSDAKNVVIVKKDEDPEVTPIKAEVSHVNPDVTPIKAVVNPNEVTHVNPVEVTPLKEIITVEKNIDETETVDDFVNDLNAILQRKGEEIEKDTKKYTLFDDAIEEE